MIIISACLAGVNCKYNGGNNLVPSIQKLVEDGKAVLVCPEQLGGLPTPRISSERKGDRVINQKGEDVTAQFKLGAQKSLEICRQNHCTCAILKAWSPSCGCHGIYDGTFSHTRIPGKGVFAELLAQEGIPCMSDEEWKEKEEKHESL